LPAVLVVVVVAGFFAGLWLRARRPWDVSPSGDRARHQQALSITRGGS
jgi:hypothetical protein